VSFYFASPGPLSDGLRVLSGYKTIFSMYQEKRFGSNRGKGRMLEEMQYKNGLGEEG